MNVIMWKHVLLLDMTELDTKRSPKEKLTCIVDCSRKIFEALRLSALKSAESNEGVATSAASADDFLPVFIFIILKACPPRLKSNINYITRFSCPSRLNSGEGGYFFTNMVRCHFLSTILGNQNFCNQSRGLRGFAFR